MYWCQHTDPNYGGNQSRLARQQYDFGNVLQVPALQDGNRFQTRPARRRQLTRQTDRRDFSRPGARKFSPGVRKGIFFGGVRTRSESYFSFARVLHAAATP